MDERHDCDGIGIGGVPGWDDLSRLHAEGVRTLIDVREGGEQGPDLAARAGEMGFRYLRAPISRSKVNVEQIDRLRRAIADSDGGKVYAFSTGGKRAMGALCFLACARVGDSVIEVFHRARKFGLAIEKESALKKFILDFYSSHRGDMLNNHFQHPRHA